jgi:4'-phosphopantetheinyl transferase
MREPLPARSGYVAVWLAVGAVPESGAAGLDQRASRYRQARAGRRVYVVPA